MPDNQSEDTSPSIKLDIVAGEITVPVAELANWMPQHVVEDEGIIYPKVQAHCNNTVVAEGELVQIGSEFGFRITRKIN